jgi:hypothetical protein
MKKDASDNKYTDFDRYLKSLYGKGMNEKLLTDLLNKSYYATYYSQILIQQWKIRIRTSKRPSITTAYAASTTC